MVIGIIIIMSVLSRYRLSFTIADRRLDENCPLPPSTVGKPPLTRVPTAAHCSSVSGIVLYLSSLVDRPVPVKARTRRPSIQPKTITIQQIEVSKQPCVAVDFVFVSVTAARRPPPLRTAKRAPKPSARSFTCTSTVRTYIKRSTEMFGPD